MNELRDIVWCFVLVLRVDHMSGRRVQCSSNVLAAVFDMWWGGVLEFPEGKYRPARGERSSDKTRARQTLDVIESGFLQGPPTQISRHYRAPYSFNEAYAISRRHVLEFGL